MNHSDTWTEPLEVGFLLLAPAPCWHISSFHFDFGKEYFWELMAAFYVFKVFLLSQPRNYIRKRMACYYFPNIWVPGLCVFSWTSKFWCVLIGTGAQCYCDCVTPSLWGSPTSHRNAYFISRKKRMNYHQVSASCGWNPIIREVFVL